MWYFSPAKSFDFALFDGAENKNILLALIDNF
jgi:hypothetical protein